MADASAARITVRLQWYLKIPGPSSWPRPLLGLAHIQVARQHDLVLYIANRDILVRSWKTRPAPSD